MQIIKQGGNVNFAFCVRDATTGKAVFVKQAPEYVAVFGPDGLPLTSDRIKKEVQILKEWNSILGDDTDKYLPKLYYFDDDNKVFVMEFLENYDLLDHYLITDPAPDSEVSAKLGKFMALTHLATHSSKVHPDLCKVLTSQYENRALRDIQLEFVFTKAYQEVSEQAPWFKVDEAFLKEVNSLKARYNGETGSWNMALCHGDLHPGSVMVKVGSSVESSADGAQVRVIDPEFCVYGPPGLDMGSLLSGYILAAVHQSFANANDKEAKEKAVSAINKGIKECWETYSLVMKKGGVTKGNMTEIETESVGFAVAEVCRTALGHAGGRLWLQFDDKEVKEAALKSALSIVQKSMFGRHTEGMDVLFDCLDAL